MENKLSSILTLIIILIVALTTYWLKLEVDKEQLLKSISLEKGPDFFLRGYKTQQTLENGEINFILSGEKMTHYEHLEKTYLISPTFIQYKNSSPYSWISGNNGKIEDKGEKITVSDNVILLRAPTKTKKQMKLFTDTLNIDTKNNIVLTKSPVKIIQEPNIEINGVGMRYDKKENTFKLLSNVKVHYENNNK
jgi:lipopolysaccharide export system protein LptC